MYKRQEYHRRTGNKQALIRDNTFLGSVYLDIGDYKNGLECLKEAHGLALQVGEIMSIVHTLCYLGLAYHKHAQYKKAKNLFKECYKLANKYKMSYMESVALLNLGDTYAKLHQIDQAINCIQKVLSMDDLKVKGIKDAAKATLKEIYANQK